MTPHLTVFVRVKVSTGGSSESHPIACRSSAGGFNTGVDPLFVWMHGDNVSMPPI